jgi:hypothetical protein
MKANDPQTKNPATLSARVIAAEDYTPKSAVSAKKNSYIVDNKNEY